jgi:hypothetical protein
LDVVVMQRQRQFLPGLRWRYRQWGIAERRKTPSMDFFGRVDEIGSERTTCAVEIV